jgi:hypothetical protein
MTAVRRMHVLQQQAGTMLRNRGYEPLITTNIGIFRYITFNLIAGRDLKDGSFDVVMVTLRTSLHAIRSLDEAAFLCREEIRCVKKFFDLVPDTRITGRFEVWFSIPWNKFQTFEITRTGIREILSPDEKAGQQGRAA